MDPKIYVASLSDYNNGILHGAWIDATQGADHIEEETNKMLATSPAARKFGDVAEEWAIHDFEGFMGITINESDSFEHVAELADLLCEHGAAYAAYVENVGADYATADGFEDSYQGEYDSEQAYAESLVEDTGMLDEMPERLRMYFDYASFARDLFMDGYSFIGGYVFADR